MSPPTPPNPTREIPAPPPPTSILAACSGMQRHEVWYVVFHNAQETQTYSGTVGLTKGHRAIPVTPAHFQIEAPPKHRAKVSGHSPYPELACQRTECFLMI
mmetsp:Transcript_146438/g.255827  ORF Transcript_146438/g.255827 Transcript_146438/m.255827 type:complete len:101 (-) Transcript_146438:606-908(-)